MFRTDAAAATCKMSTNMGKVCGQGLSRDLPHSSRIWRQAATQTFKEHEKFLCKSVVWHIGPAWGISD